METPASSVTRKGRYRLLADSSRPAETLTGLVRNAVSLPSSTTAAAVCCIRATSANLAARGRHCTLLQTGLRLILQAKFTLRVGQARPTSLLVRMRTRSQAVVHLIRRAATMYLSSSSTRRWRACHRWFIRPTWEAVVATRLLPYRLTG